VAALTAAPAAWPPTLFLSVTPEEAGRAFRDEDWTLMQAEEAFVIRGMVLGHPTDARWKNGQLVITENLLLRAEAIVAMGQRFTTQGGRRVQAALDCGPLPAPLTIMHAFDRISSAEIAPWIETDPEASRDPTTGSTPKIWITSRH